MRRALEGRWKRVEAPGFTLAEVLVVAGLWSVMAAGLCLSHRWGTRGLRAALASQAMGRTAMRLEALLETAAEVAEPGAGRTGERLVLVTREGSRVEVLRRAGMLVAIREGAAEETVLARTAEYAYFHVRGGAPAVVRYLVGIPGAALLSSSFLGGSRDAIPTR